MNIHEYQAKQVFRESGIVVPDGYLAESSVEAEFAYRRLKSPVAVVKAQIHAGGRGKAGGVKLVKSPEETFEVASKMLGSTLVTPQTGAEGKKVHKLYIEAASQIKKEFYLAFLIERESASIAIMFSTEGGMDIEEVAEKTPEKITTVTINPTLGLRSHQLRSLAKVCKDYPAMKRSLPRLIKKLFAMFCKNDFSLLEINPLVLTESDHLIPLDGKMNFDENALYRHPKIAALRDFREENSREIEASKYGLSYIGLDGTIGCLVNGAGLAMATMDIIKHSGGEPANFLDVGGGATEEMVTNAFRLILQDEKVKGIFVNIFGGIMQCDIIAKGIIAASKDLKVSVPLVVRLEGTNVEAGQKLLKASKLNITSAENMGDGAKKIVSLTT